MARRFVSFAVAMGLVAAGLVATGAAADTRKRVAVLPVVVHASGDNAYLQSGMADMLAARLGREPGVAVIRVTDPAHATTQLGPAQEAARSVGADYVLYGSFTRFGEGASLDVRCAGLDEESEGSPKAIFIQSGQLGELIPRLDQLAEKVGRYVRAGTLPPVGAGGSAATAGPSAAQFEALRARVDALEAALDGAAAAKTALEAAPAP